MARRTRSRVCCAVARGPSLMTYETTAGETPARSATSRWVIRRGRESGSWLCGVTDPSLACRASSSPPRPVRGRGGWGAVGIQGPHGRVKRAIPSLPHRGGRGRSSSRLTGDSIEALIGLSNRFDGRRWGGSYHAYGLRHDGRRVTPQHEPGREDVEPMSTVRLADRSPSRVRARPRSALDVFWGRLDALMPFVYVAVLPALLATLAVIVLPLIFSFGVSF